MKRSRPFTSSLAYLALLVVALLAVLMLYQRPDFLLMVGQVLWACF